MIYRRLQLINERSFMNQLKHILSGLMLCFSITAFAQTSGGALFNEKGEAIESLLRDEKAKDGLATLLQKLSIDSATEQKNVDEFAAQKKFLESRGFEAIEKPLVGPISIMAQGLSLTHNQNHGSLREYRFTYIQSFLEKGVPPSVSVDLPSLRMDGIVYLETFSGKPYEVAMVLVRQVSVQWMVPASSRGANSSAGGSGRGR